MSSSSSSSLKNMIFCVTLFVLIKVSISQDCRSSGQYCLSHENCCGGCCRNRACIDTYDLCTVDEDPCSDHICPPNSECHIYQPDCKGCEAVAYCS